MLRECPSEHSVFSTMDEFLSYYYSAVRFENEKCETKCKSPMDSPTLRKHASVSLWILDLRAEYDVQFNVSDKVMWSRSIGYGCAKRERQ